jgi:hypothetical protein
MTAMIAGVERDQPMPQGRTPKVAVIVADGARYDTIVAASTPNFDSLAAKGIFAPSYITDTAMTLPLSGPGHSSLLTGVWPDKHRVFDNEFTAHNLSQYPTVFSRLAWLAPHLITFSSADWEPMNRYLVKDALLRHRQAGPDVAATDGQTVDAFTAALESERPDVALLYFHSPDAAGHAHGSDSDDYLRAIEATDARIGLVLDALSDREGEDWLVLISTDHGQTGDLHGGDEATTRTAWIASNCSGIDLDVARARSWRQVDIVPTILRHLGIAPDAEWGLDGVPIGTPSDDPFDRIAPPAGRPTSSLPDGWARSRGAEPAERQDYDQWCLVAAHDWAAIDAIEGRGSFVRGRDVIAVADPRRRDPGQARDGVFDSTLYSPWTYSVPGRTIFAEFRSHFRRWGDATGFHASVRAEFDDGTVEQLWLADRPGAVMMNEHISLAARCVPKARRVRIAWRLVDEAASSYWAIDEPRVELDV